MIFHFSCDADPNALARYVIALVRKDKPDTEVRNICLNQLEVFLASGNKSISILALLQHGQLVSYIEHNIASIDRLRRLEFVTV